MKKTLALILFSLTLMTSSLFAKQELIHMKMVQTDKDLYCVFDKDVTFVKKGDFLIQGFIDTQCAVKKSDADAIKVYNDNLIKNSLLKAKAIHGTVLIFLLILISFIVLKKKELIKVMVPALSVFVVIELLFVLFNLNIVAMIINTIFK